MALFDWFKKRKKILIIDKEISICRILARRFEVKGYAVSTALETNSARKLLKKNEKKQFVLMIMDNDLVDEEGLQFCREMKKDPSYQHIPIVIFACTGDNDFELRCIQSGAEGIIYKPMLRELFEITSRILSGEKINWEEYNNPPGID